jgi:hypothetical protein
MEALEPVFVEGSGAKGTTFWALGYVHCFGSGFVF